MLQVLLGDLNAKHTAWGCALANNRGQDLKNLSNDKAFLFLNNGTHTYRSHSYNTTDALDLPSLVHTYFHIAYGKLLTMLEESNWQDLCKSLDYKTPNTRLWRLAKKLDKIQPQVENTNSIIGINGTPTVNDKEAADALGNYYSEESKLALGRANKKTGRATRKLIRSCRVPASNELFNDPITSSELLYAIQQLDFKKSPGPGGIHGQFIVNLGTCATKRFLHIFNLSWKLGKLPRQWKTAIVVPIRKPNKDASCMGSYRPIALTCMTCKLMERIILRRITFHLMNRNMLSQEQYGFRKGHSTIDQILYFVQRVRDAHNMKPSRHTIAVFLDLTKAFDKVWKTGEMLFRV
ncbi:probable RNA-directed DNA polymerase from transposon BS [Caerostris darwini]|uniref:Probable RNA-directed DNA polymerase from transposon BS n=1 Tax=Caerostris darwini TaxID=1538125 RepID=A0AAV4X8F7_9ARAC|nr:probable RNA-directed DNA polymerase from transposon BS [Caerostris darwini]